ncbi:MAG TPA: hypothetical protein VG013_10875 [Gemmataceae bacterium]|jgi:hypothetical protein|nr:hypothetical protein [Gemmataceae bacterium]
MHRGNPPRLRPLAILQLLFLAFSSAGCVPGVGWLPDSSGFVYTAGKNNTQLALYDLVKGEPHVLVEDTGAGTYWPAVSPDGQRLAVAKLTMTKGRKQTTLQVVLYSRAGKELKRSKVFDWMELEHAATSATETDRRVGLPQLFWAPKGDKIIVHAAGYTAIYEVKADRLVHAGAGTLLSFGGTPVRPDGAGFLIMKNAERWVGWWNQKANGKKGNPDPGFTFVDWHGKERPLKPPAFLFDAAALEKEKDANKLVGLLCPALYDSGWEGEVARVSWNVDRLRYLTSRGEAVVDHIKPDKTEDGLLVKQRYRFPGTLTQLRFVVTRWDDKKPENAGPVRVEVLKAGRKKPQVILDKIEGYVLIPAPNRKLVALRTAFLGGKGPKDREQVIIVNDKGEVVAQVPIDR